MAKKGWQPIARAVLTALVCAYALCIYIPVVSFWGNVNTFPFTISQLLLGMALPFACVWLLLAALLWLTEDRVFGKLLGKTKEGAEQVSPLHIGLLLLVLCLWLEGFLLNRGLPQLTGEADLFSSMPRMALDLCVWALILLLGLSFWRVLAKAFPYVLVSVALLLALGTADAAISQTPNAVSTTVTSNDVLDRSTFYTEDNVLILLTDAMSTALIQDYIADNPDVSERLDGFVFFKNNIEGATGTQWSIPSIFKGEVYTGGPVLAYQTTLFSTQNSLAQRFLGAGYDVYSSSTIPMFNTVMTQEGGQIFTSRAYVAITPQIYGQFFLRFAPYALKNTIANRVGTDARLAETPATADGNLAALPQRHSENKDELTYLALMHAIGQQQSRRPTFHFHHVNGAHMPYTTDRNGGRLAEADSQSLHGLREQTIWTLDYVMQVLDELKATGLYDSTTIVLLGDHGDRLEDDTRENMAYALHAALLIKPKGSHGPLETSDAPTSNTYLQSILPALHLEGQSLAALTADLPQERSLLMGSSSVFVYEGADVTQMKMIREIPVEQVFEANTLKKGSLYALSTLLLTGDIAYPFETDGVDFTNGWGLRTQQENPSFSFKVDGAPGEQVKVSFKVTTGSLSGSPEPFDAYKLYMRDKTSGQTYEFDINTTYHRITLDTMTIASNSTLQFEVSFSKYPDPQKLHVSFETIEIEDVT